MNIQPISEQIWKQKYRFKEETMQDTLKRVSFSLFEREEAHLAFKLMSEFKFSFAGRILYGVGTERRDVTYSNCYVIPILGDSLDAILKAEADAAKTMKAGGGCGYNFSILRPKNALIETSGEPSSGAVSFIHSFDAKAEVIKAGGNRRAANIAVLGVWHPDIEEFIEAKRTGRLQNFNLSVAISDDFMQAVNLDEEWELIFPDFENYKDAYNTYWTGNIDEWVKAGFGIKLYKTLKAKDLYEKIIKSNYEYAEPGVLYIDTVNRMNPTNYIEFIDSTNPCGEVPLPPYGSCNLGMVNLANLVNEPFTSNANIEATELSRTVHLLVKGLDKVLDINYYPLPEQREVVKNKRQLGIGITGLADMLAMMGLKYGSEEGRKFAENIMRQITNEAYRASALLAKEYGPFPLFKVEEYLEHPFIKQLDDDVKMLIKKHGLRNNKLISIAPTGTTSLFMNNVSSGIEPIFQLEYKRKIRQPDGSTVEEVVMDYAWWLYNKLGKTGYEEYFQTINDLTVNDHILMQASLQKWVDNSISKCIAKGTLITTDKGIYRVEELMDEKTPTPDTFYTPNNEYFVIDENGNKQKIKSVYYYGESKGVKVRFENGLEITSSLTHKFKTAKGWVSAADLNIGDRVFYRTNKYEDNAKYQKFPEVIVPNNQSKKVQLPSIIDEKVAKFIGAFLADGFSTQNSLGICEKNEHVNKEISELMYYMFGKEKITTDKRTGVRTHLINSRYIAEFFKSWCGDNAVNKKVPNEILASPLSVQLAFLEGLTLDGYITTNGLRKTLVIYEGYSKQIVNAVAAILSRLGVEYLITDRNVTNGRLSNITYGIKAYFTEQIITPLELHKQKYELYEKKSYVFIPENKIEGIVSVIGKGIKASYQRRNFKNRMKKDSFINRKFLNNINAKDLVDMNLLGLKITNIEYVDTVDLYDIEVENTHSYLISGVVSHNTINVPENYPYEDFKDIYKKAWELGLKGCTTYRPNAILGSVLSTTKETSSEDKFISEPDEVDIGPIVPGMSYEIVGHRGESNWITVNTDDYGNPMQVFIMLPKESGMDDAGNFSAKLYFDRLSDTNFIARLISLALRHGIPVEKIVKQAHKSSYNVFNLAFKLRNILLDFVNPETTKAREELKDLLVCPDCGGTLIMEAGCSKCIACGFSKCG